MRINVTQTIKDLEGNALKDADGVETTFRRLFYIALNNFKQDERATIDLKEKCYALMHKLYQNKEVKITVDEAALLKERVGNLFSPLEYGRVCELLEGAKPDDEPAEQPAKK